MSEGILSASSITALTANAHIHFDGSVLGDGQIQPASLDLRLGRMAYRLRASFLPGPNRSVRDCLDDLSMHEINLEAGAVLETGCVYLVPLLENLSLPDNLSAAANPKSSTGRLDVFTRVIGDGCSQFDAIPHGYTGPLYLEIAPRTFSILVRTGDRLAQIRFRDGAQKILATETVTIDLEGEHENAVIGYRARRHSGLVDIAHVGGHAAKDYWEPIYAPDKSLILDPNEFYILVSKEAVSIPANHAAEMAPIATEIGEFRAHYAGFFDPGFGMGPNGSNGSKAVLEVRGRDVPFMLRHGQAVARLVFEPMQDIPDILYGQNGSNYQGQSLRLSKHFKS
jgi:dCTP deaminase